MHDAARKVPVAPVPSFILFALLLSLAGGVLADEARSEVSVDDSIILHQAELVAPPEIQRLIKQHSVAAPANGAPPVNALGETIILNEGFEGTWPAGLWTTSAQPGFNLCVWAKTLLLADVGVFSASPVAGVCAGQPLGPYPPLVFSWAVYGPFSLSDATTAQMDFRLAMSLEPDADFFYWGSSIDGSNFSFAGATGGSFTWANQSLDLSGRAGQSQVWIAFLMQTDNTTTAHNGVLVDEVVITKSDAGTTADLALQLIDIDPGPYLPEADITIFTDVENIGAEISSGYQIEYFASTNTTITESDASLGVLNRSAVDAGASDLINVNASLHPGLSEGQYYIGAIVTVVDADSNNHVNHDPVPITISTDPDINIRPLSLSYTEEPAPSPAAESSASEIEAVAATRAATRLGLETEVRNKGEVRVIVGLDVPFQPQGGLSSSAAAAQQANIQSRQAQLTNDLRGLGVRETARYRFIPYMALSVDERALQELYRSPIVTSIEPDTIDRAFMASSNSVIGSPLAWAEGYDGTGLAVAVLDTGVDNSHPWFTTGSKIVSEACYSTTVTDVSNSFCPGGAPSSTAPGSGDDCGVTDGCDHGTHVAGTVAGNNGSGPDYGVARGADIIAMQVFSQFIDPADCGDDPTPCTLTYSSDQISALERVLELSATIDIAGANMSLGGGQYFSQASCDAANGARKAAIDNLRSAGIATIISAGNDGFKDSIGAPGCISTAVSVGATTDSDQVADFSNIYPEIHLLAPGVSINSSVPGGGTDIFQGTSMSAPHVAGAWAALRQVSPATTVTDILSTLESTATPVDDLRVGGIETGMPRINLDLALGADRTTFGIFNAGPGSLTVTSIAPDLSASWLSWDPPAPFDVPATGLQVVTVSVNYGLAPQGTTTVRRLLVSSNDPGNSPFPGGVDVSVTTLGAAAPEFDSTPAAGATLAFGNVVVAATSGAQTVTVNNLGTAALTITCGLVGTNPGEFNITNCPASIASAGSDSVSVNCEPSGLGAKTATLRLTTNDTDEGTVDFSLTCTGTDVPAEDDIFKNGFE